MASIVQIGSNWRALVRKGGHVRCKTFSTQGAAKSWSRTVEQEIEQLKATGRIQPKGLTIGDLIDRYEREIFPIKPWGRSKTADLRRLKVGFGTIPAGALDYKNIVDYFTRMREQGAGGVGISSQIGYLIAVLDTASNLWRLAVPLETAKDVRSALKKLGMVKKSNVRERRVSDAEIDRIATHLERKESALPLRDLLEFCVTTSMRISEVCRIEWQDLNEETKMIRIRDRKHPTAKQGNHQDVPMLTVAGHDSFEIVKRQARKNRRIFPADPKTVSGYFTKACAQLEIDDLRLHDLRHEAISRLFEAGFSIQQVSLVSGHRDWAMLRRYTHLKPADLHKGAKAQ